MEHHTPCMLCLQEESVVSVCGNGMVWLSLLFADPAGLEYDLDLFNIVAVSDFNMGAMENK